MAKDANADARDAEMLQTALLSVFSDPRDRMAPDGAFRGTRRAVAYRAVFADEDVMRVMELVERAGAGR